jgi:hypothetical protein
MSGRTWKPLSMLAIAVAIACSGTAAEAASKEFSLFGNAQVVAGAKKNQYAVLIESDLTSPNTADWYGGIAYDPKKPIRFEDIRSLNAVYTILEGGFGGGSARFSIGVDGDGDGEVDGNVFVYFGTPPNFDDEPNGEIEFTGEFIGGTDLRFDTSKVGGEFYDDYQGALELVGDADVLYIDLVVDAGWFVDGGVQSVLIHDLQVHKSKYKPKKPKKVK